MSSQEERVESYRRTVAIFVAIVVLGLAFMIIRPFLIAILSAAALAYLFYPFYLTTLKYLPKKMRAKEIGAIFTCLVIILLVLIPVTLVTIFLGLEVKSGYFFLQEYLQSPHKPLIRLPAFININQFSEYLPQFNEIAANVAGQLIGVLQNILKGIPNTILLIFITLFSSYYFLKHGKDLYNFFSDIIPLPEGRNKQILQRFDDLSRGMILGQVVVGMVQGTLAWIGFAALGVPNPILWAFLTSIISIIPLLGAALVWFPIMIYLFLVGMVTGEYWRSAALLFYGTFVISLIDNFLKPKIVGDRAKIHPLLILLGILGGIQLFGIPGILIGPLILTIFDVVIEIYKETI
jgi:predicted PurR-regulated permease PerM